MKGAGRGMRIGGASQHPKVGLDHPFYAVNPTLSLDTAAAVPRLPQGKKGTTRSLDLQQPCLSPCVKAASWVSPGLPDAIHRRCASGVGPIARLRSVGAAARASEKHARKIIS